MGAYGGGRGPRSCVWADRQGEQDREAGHGRERRTQEPQDTGRRGVQRGRVSLRLEFSRLYLTSLIPLLKWEISERRASPLFCLQLGLWGSTWPRILRILQET